MAKLAKEGMHGVGARGAGPKHHLGEQNMAVAAQLHNAMGLWGYGSKGLHISMVGFAFTVPLSSARESMCGVSTSKTSKAQQTKSRLRLL